jgi:hypothetical protein
VRILIQGDGEKPRPLEEGYASEAELQSFLRDHSELIPMEDIEIGTPPLLCIGWEVFATSGAEDLLYVDETGRLTIVETKLRKNAEARREVVGQILEYAAQTVGWSASHVETKANAFLSSLDCPVEYRSLTFQSAMERFLENAASPRRSAFSYQTFLTEIEAKLKDGQIRLVIAIDEPPEPLLRIVEFVNHFSEHFDLYLFQLKRFRDDATTSNIFVPAMFGRVTATSDKAKGEVWNEQRFTSAVQELKDNVLADAIIAVYDEFRRLTDVPLWGTGKTYGSFNLVVHAHNHRVNLASITSTGLLYISFGALAAHGFTEVLDTLAAELRSIPGLSLPSDLSRKYPSLGPDVLKDGGRRARIVAAIERAIHGLRQHKNPNDP